LEALGWTDEWRPQGLKEEAITAIKAALLSRSDGEAKDEPVFHKPHLDIEGPLHVVCRCPVCKAQPQQEAKDEPVAYLPPTVSPENACYTSPQRTWVALTDEEIDKAWRSVDYTVPWDQHRIDIARAIEAKLKEKNA
jgi:hypothetical protein